MSFKVIDISKDLTADAPSSFYPPPQLGIYSSAAAGSGFNAAMLSTVLHCGSFALAPLYCFEKGKTINSIPLELFAGECRVIEIKTERITGEYVDRHFPKGEKRLLLKSSGRAYFDRTGAEEAAFYGYKLIGTDSVSVAGGCEHPDIYKTLLGEGLAVLENLDLSAVTPGKYFLSAFPIKIAGVEAAPVRAVLFDGYVFWSN